MKPGWKTTEFWATVVFHLTTVAMLVLGHVEGQWAVGAMGFVQVLYNWSRGHVKASSLLVLLGICFVLVGCATADQGLAQRANDQTNRALTVIVNPMGNASPDGSVDWNRMYDEASTDEAKTDIFNEMVEHAKSANISLSEDFVEKFGLADTPAEKKNVVASLAKVLVENATLPGYVKIGDVNVNITVTNSGTSEQSETGGAQSPSNDTDIPISGLPKVP